ncbi:hypothetical protein OS493_030930 [Desmophyllum pertusum]|uniref:Ionotropic glutamate receptor L-glutamate and glycine-binding domain-containing protein n=1 Tax=Desmophyllum pertusum TaxID=174260 RepID=A0A9W9ZY06_9CNID|nr:hypothetical protein OS493_030930 [Desmophyllum pertusum]
MHESPGDFTKVAFPSMYRYATSAWRMIKKHRWRTLCLVLSADYEGKAFADGMLSYTLQEKWQLLHIVWLMDDTIGNGTKAELQDVITKGSDAIVMHSRMGHDVTFFEMIQELGVSKQGTVWIITEMTIQLDTNWQKLPQGLLKISLRRPEKHHDYIIYGNALHDAMSLFQHSFEESVKEYYDEDRDVDCVKVNTAKEIRRIAKRHMAQKFLPGKSMLFDHQTINNKNGAFTIWNLKRDGIGVKKWFPVGMAAITGLAIEKFTAPNGKSITPVSDLPRPVVYVAVNEYPSLVYKVDPGSADRCFGRSVPCYEYIRNDNVPKKFCCFGASLDFLSFLQTDLDFEAHIYFTPDGQYGVFNDSSGKWNGIVQELLTGRAMLSLEMGMNRMRAEVIQFAHPTLRLELGILVNRIGHQEITRDSWLHPFSTVLWLSLIATACVIFIVIWWLDRKSPQGYYHMFKGRGEDGFTLLDSISYVGGVAFGKDIGPVRTPRSTSSRLVSYVYSFLALIMINTYCANLMAFLVEKNVGLPITGIDDPQVG